MTLRRAAPRLVLLAAILGAIVWAGLNRGRLDPVALDAWLSGLGVWAPAIYVALYIAGTVAFLPGSLFALAGGALFGPVWGAALNLLGATLGASLAFLAARYLAADWVARKAAGRLKRLVAGVEAEGWRFVAFVRLVPLFPFNLTNYALGLTRIGFLPYVLTSLVCMAPGAIAYTWLGHAGREALAGDAAAIRYGLLALGLLAAIAFLPRLVGRLRRGGAGAGMEPEELRRRTAAGEPVTILDVRGPDEFAGPIGHIGGAVNIPLGELEAGLDRLRAESRPIAIVCRTDRRSAAAEAKLRDAGFAEVSVLSGGMERWKALGFETERGPPQHHGRVGGGDNRR